MFADLELIITATEPTAGENVTLRYGNTTAFGSFRLSAVAEQVAQLNAALEGGMPPSTLWQATGRALFAELFSGDLIRLYAQATAPGQQLRLRLMSHAPDLLAVPWEYLYDERPIALDRERSLVRSLAVPGRKPVAVAVDEALRVLVMISDPADLTRLDVAAEWTNLVNATATAAIDLIRIEPTDAALQSALRQHQPHVFHFVGHGTFDDASQTGLLYLQKPDGNATACPAERLATLLSGCDTVRLALLNACQGATPGGRSTFAGVAQGLIQQGLPAVIAMGAPILDRDALAFSQEFYRALADGYPLEAAVGEGRKRIAEHSTAWGVPALYFQGSEPFALPVLTNSQKAERLWQKAQHTSDATTQRRQLEQAARLAHDHRGVQQALARLDKEAEATRLYAAAEAYLASQEWRAAYRDLRQVEGLVRNFRNTRSLLAEVQTHLNGAPRFTPSETSQFAHYAPILDALRNGRLTPFLGPDVVRFGRPAPDGWVQGLYPPVAAEAAADLAHRLGDAVDGLASLPEISQYTTLLDSKSGLYDRLAELYSGEYQPTMLHHLLAELPARLRHKGYPTDPQRRFVIFSTAFDTLLEQAFTAVEQPYHLFAYRHPLSTEGVVQPACFLHIPPSGETIEVLSPNNYTGHAADGYPVLVKLCGRGVTAEPESVIVTEDHYLEYLPAQEIGALLPMTLLNQIQRRSFLFFCYSLQPWYFRLLWQRMRYQKRRLHDRSWAIVPTLTRIEEEFWRSQEIVPIQAFPEGVVAYVNQWLDQLEARV